MYYIGIIILIGCYILLGLNYNKYSTNVYSLISIIVVIFSGLTTALYSNLIEKHLFEFTNDKLKIELFCQIINNIYGFIFFVPLSFGFCMYNKSFVNEIIPNLIYLLVGLSFQIYFLFKIFILGYSEYAGSQIVSSLDLIRRVFTNIISYGILQEYYNNEIIGANIFMIIGGIFLILSQKKNIKYDLLKNEIELNKL